MSCRAVLGEGHPIALWGLSAVLVEQVERRAGSEPLHLLRAELVVQLQIFGRPVGVRDGAVDRLSRRPVPDVPRLTPTT